MFYDGRVWLTAAVDFMSGSLPSRHQAFTNRARFSGSPGSERQFITPFKRRRDALDQVEQTVSGRLNVPDVLNVVSRPETLAAA
jgi:hypothetical protein